MSDFDELDVLMAIRDVAVPQIALDRLDQRVATALNESGLPRRRGPLARHLSRLTITVGVTAPVLVVVALALLSGAKRSANAPQPSLGKNAPAATRAQLLRTLGVLRRPPDAASRQAIACVKAPPAPASPAFRACRSSAVSLAVVPFAGAGRFGSSSGVRLDASLIRVIRVPRSRDRVALVPATAPVSPGSRRRAEGLEIFIAFRDGSASPGPAPSSVSQLRSQGLAVSGSNATPRMRSVLGAVIVPDGVAAVTLRPVRVIAAPTRIDPRRFGTSASAVHDNIAGYRFSVPYVSDPRRKSLVYAVIVETQATWSDRHGKAIARTSLRLQLWLKLRGNNGRITATN